ncbi:hypothetical protein ABT095_38675 [Kitasatospora sp. NPDC002227]
MDDLDAAEARVLELGAVRSPGSRRPWRSGPAPWRRGRRSP